MSNTVQLNKRRRQAGFTLLELMIAGAVLTVGMLSLVGLFVTAIGNNGRSRVDSSATMIAGSVIEQVTAALLRPTDSNGVAKVVDCAGNTFLIDYGTGGANLGDEDRTGDGERLDPRVGDFDIVAFVIAMSTLFAVGTLFPGLFGSQ